MKCGICERKKTMRAVKTSSQVGYFYVCTNPNCPDHRGDHDVETGPDGTVQGGNSGWPAGADIRKLESGEAVPGGVELRKEGVKLDQGKPPVFTEFLMQFPRSIRMVARVGEAGSKATGHVRSGWKAVENGYLRYSDAAMRHLLEEAMMSTDHEPDSSDPTADLIWQAATVAWNNLARLEHLIRENAAAAERLDPKGEA